MNFNNIHLNSIPCKKKIDQYNDIKCKKARLLRLHLTCSVKNVVPCIRFENFQKLSWKKRWLFFNKINLRSRTLFGWLCLNKIGFWRIGMSHTCYFGFKSGDFASQSILSIVSSYKYRLTTLARWGLALSLIKP